jgi:hypothetical protein
MLTRVDGDGRDDLAVNAFTSSAITLLLSTGRTTCPTFHGHYRMGFRADNIELPVRRWSRTCSSPRQALVARRDRHV